MKKIQKNYELNTGESFRLDKNGLHGVTAQGRIKMSLLLVLEEKHLQNAEDRRLSGMEGGRSFCSKQENTGTEKGAISLINGVSKAEIWLNVQN